MKSISRFVINLYNCRDYVLFIDDKLKILLVIRFNTVFV